MLNNTNIPALTPEQIAAITAIVMQQAAPAAVPAAAPTQTVKSAKQTETWIVPVKQYNNDRQGIELVFDGKPVKEIRQYVADSGFHWNRAAKVWYMKQSPAAEQIAAEVIRNIKNHTLPTVQTAPAAAPVAAPAPAVKAEPAPAAPTKKDPVLHVGLTFTAVTNDGHELTYTATDYPDGGKVKVKGPDGKPAGAFELRKTDAGRLYIVVHKRPAILNK